MRTRTAGIALVAAGIMPLPALASNARPVDGALRQAPLPTLPAGKAWVPTGRGLPAARPLDKAQRPRRDRNGIRYHHGPVMTATKTIYYIWYGSWSSSSEPVQVLPSLAMGIGGSPYFNINTTYTDGWGTPVSNSATYGGATMVPAYLGNSLSDANVLQIVADAIGSGTLPSSQDAVYFVLTGDVPVAVELRG